MSKFDAAIEAIQQVMDYGGYWERHYGELDSAIRVLDAAAKVDKAWACGDGPDDPEKAQAVNELLHALPDDTDAREKP